MSEQLINLTLEQPQQINVVINQLAPSIIESITPFIAVKGKDGVNGKDGANGFIGRDGEKGEAGYTPVKNIDYFDGIKGDKGDTGITGSPSVLSNRIVEIRVTNAGLIVGNKGSFFIPEELDGGKIIKVEACINTTGTTGTTINIINLTKGLTITSIPITINAGQKTSYTAVIRSGINLTNQIVNTANEICTNISGVGTGAAGLSVIITFEK